MRKAWIALAILAAALLFAGCGGAPAVDQPPEIRYGEDVCDTCAMIISEPRFASAYYTPEGEARRFDDTGGLVTYYLEREEEVASFWVHDYETEAWLEANEAFFVVSDDFFTPMAFGVVAVGDLGRASALAEENQGEVMSFEELVNYFRGGRRSGEETHDHDHADSH